METLIGLLLLLLPAIFKVVEKKLNASGKAGSKGVAPAVAVDEEDADEPEEIAPGPLRVPAGTSDPEVTQQPDVTRKHDPARQSNVVLKHDLARQRDVAPAKEHARPVQSAYPVRKPVQKR